VGTFSQKKSTSPNTIQITCDKQIQEMNLTCGISQVNPQTGGEMNVLCAFPLIPSQTVEIVPLEKVVLMFATSSYSTGSVMTRTIGEAIKVDLTQNPQMKLVYKKNGWVEQDTARILDDGTDLLPELFESSGSLKSAVLRSPKRKEKNLTESARFTRDNEEDL